MAVPMQCDVFQKEIAGDEVEASQLLTQKWYFSRKEIELHSPSRSDGIDYKQEQHLRKLYCSFLQELGIELKVPQVSIATSMMFCHRFYMRQSHAKNDWQTIATASMFLACKAEETPRWLGELVVVAYKLIYKGDRSAPRRIREIYDKQKELILIAERLLLYVIAFDLNIEHPYKSLVAALKRLDINHKELVKVAWNFVNDWLRTSLCLQYKPPYIAAGSLFLASKIMKVKLATSKGKAWWMEFDVSPKQLEDVIQQMMRLWERGQSQSQTLAPKDQKVTQSPVRKTNAQTSDSGSGGSVVEDANITEPVTVKSDLRSTCKAVSAGGIIENSMVVDVNKTLEPKDQKVTQSLVRKINAQTSDLGSLGSVVEDANITEPVTVKSDLNSTCKTVSAGGIIGNSVVVDVNKTLAPKDQKVTQYPARKTNAQTSDSDSGGSVVEDGNITKPVTVKSDLSSTCKMVSAGGIIGNSVVVDVNKIREKLRNRNLIKTMKRKRGEEGIDDEMDAEEWIERELENGIVLQSARPDKQRKIEVLAAT